MKRVGVIASAVICLVALGACGETPQANRGSLDTAAFEGAKNPFVDAGWTAGDKNSWEQHLRTRMQRGQNDYSRMQ